MTTLHDVYELLPVAASGEVVVVGAGPAGLCAAVAAAEEGAETLLVERYGFMGGMATAALVNPFMRYMSGDEVVNAGVFARILQKLEQRGARAGTDAEQRAFDPQVLKLVCDELVAEAGVRVHLHTFLVDAIASDGRVQRGVVSSKSGLQAIAGEVFVDASGDADLAARAGAEFEMGRPEDGLCQPMTLYFRMAGVDEARLPSYEQIAAMYLEEKAAGRIENPRDDVHGIIYTTHPGEVTFNTTRVLGHDATNAASMTEVEIIARQQIEQLVRFLRERVAGFEQAYLCSIAPQTGVRESRRVLGDYVLSGEDVTTARKFADGIARGCFSIDIHNPTGHGIYAQRVPAGDAYDIPYRCLTPRGFANLLVAGRPISADHYAHGSLRVMPIAASTGEAAGIAAAMCVREGETTRGIDVSRLRKHLKQRGASVYEAADASR